MVVSLLVSLLLVPFAAWAAYLSGVRQDSRRWLRERRAELYVDLLVEAFAEKQWALSILTEREIADIEEDPERRREAAREWREEHDRLIPGVRMGPVERARLGARMDAYGTAEVARLFGAIGRGLLLPLRGGRSPSTFEVEESFDTLQARIRQELGNRTQSPLFRRPS